jgi:Fanconi anemia group M protein
MKITPRAYQLAIYHSILNNGNTLVILPTGLGKTLIALLLIRDKMKEGRCLFLTPTKPLAKQHFASVKEILELDDNAVALVTGELKPEKRKDEYNKKIIISTPQTTKNDIENGILTPDFSLVIFDEAHRAIKNYAYTFVAKKCENALIVGLTASPGSKKERINEIVNALRIKNIEIRTTFDEDVKPYVQQSFIKWIPVSLSPTLMMIKNELDKLIGEHAKTLGSLGFPPPLKHKGQFMKLRERILSMPPAIKYPALLQYSILLHLLHMSELVETQGLHTLRTYIAKLREKETKATKMLVKKELVNVVKLMENAREHPKLKYLIELVKSLGEKKIIVFAQYREQIKLIENELKAAGIAARQFVGKKGEFTRKMQEETIAAFREGQFNVLVSTSIGEEGLDIPAVDAVIFYEPIPSEIRSIQRRGRAARFKKGEIYILMTKGTRDEWYYWASLNKEKKMREVIAAMQKNLEHKKKTEENEQLQNTKKHVGQTKISHFFDN